MAQILKFFDERHLYELDGEQIPSVSEITRFASREVYGEISQFTLDNAADRGSKVHKACQLIDLTGECEVTEDIAPYVQNYLQFLKDYRPEWEAVEKAMASTTHKFAGTLDRVGRLNTGKFAIVDLKSSSVVQKILAQIQLNGYKINWEENFPALPIDALYILHLTKEPSTPKKKGYKLIEFPIDDTLFMSCLNLHRAFEKKPRKKKEQNNE